LRIIKPKKYIIMFNFLLKLFRIREYTGVRDKNGKRIFVNDIVERWGNLYVVTNEQNYRMKWIIDDCVNRHPDNKCIVHGNTMDNPELLF